MCAEGETRTRMSVKTHAPETCVSTNFTTSAERFPLFGNAKIRRFNPTAQDFCYIFFNLSAKVHPLSCPIGQEFTPSIHELT
jgi:hypothetical protein